MPIRKAKIPEIYQNTEIYQYTENTKYWQGCGAVGTLIHCWWECKIMQPLSKIV